MDAAHKNTESTIDDIYALKDGQRAELINGQMYMMTPPKRIHQRICAELVRIIGNYIHSQHGICEVYPAPFAVFLKADDNCYVEPDISVICDKDKLDERGCNGAPDWIIEIVSPGNPGHDYITKLNLYADAGVLEYWIVDPGAGSILVYYLAENNFQVEKYSFQDKIKVSVYGDFSIDFSELNF